MWTIKCEKEKLYDKRNIHGEDLIQGLEDFKTALELMGYDKLLAVSDDAAMEMAENEMDGFDGYYEALEEDEIDEFQAEVSMDSRTNCGSAMGECIAKVLGIDESIRIDYLGVALWEWRVQGYSYFFEIDYINIDIIEI